ncbi:hypothetical protein [Bradyrhizobium sp. WSM2793]|uniref:RNA polymerase factor sigma-54 n=1 Tax=Bradyrhizobium sp. WSM2793 TaxID=1038866 RepID=UPI00039D36E0
MDMISKIRRLDPQRALKFGTSRTQYRTGCTCGAKTRGGWHVELNSDTLPRVLVNEIYCKELSKTIGNHVEMTYFSDRLQYM